MTFGRVGFRRALPDAENERLPVEGWRVSTGWKRVCPFVKRRDGFRCAICGSPELYHRSPTGKRMSNLLIGHRTPPERYQGSPLDVRNLWTLCSACNASQGNRTELEWRAARSGRLVELGLAGPQTPDPASSVVVKDYS